MTQDIKDDYLRRSFLKLEEFRIAEKYIDVTIRCGNDCFKCHRVTLAMASTFFDSLFDGLPEENAARSAVTNVQEIFFLNNKIPAVKEFKLILQFIYSGLVPTNSPTDKAREYFGLTVAGQTQDTDSAKLRQLYSKLEEFCVAEKYSDVTIKCGTKYFKCHRLILATASEFFDDLFGSRKADIGETFEVADEVGFEVFEQILKFIYCGETTIDSSNIFNLLRACEYFRLTDSSALLSLFEKFASEENNMSHLEITTDRFCFPSDNEFLLLSSILVGNITTERFASCSNSRNIMSILQNMAEAFRKKLFLRASSRWNSDRIRLPDQIQLTTNTSEANVAGSINQVGLNRPPEIDYRQVPETSRATAFRKDLKVYLRSKKDCTVNIFSIDDKKNFNLSGQVRASFVNGPSMHVFRTVALDHDHLYCYVCYRLLCAKNFVRCFCRCSSADLRDMIELKDPPIVRPSTGFSLCVTKNDIIYACTKIPDPSSAYGKVSDGIHFYSCSLDNWFPVPPLEEEIYNRCATTVGDILYLFGKSNSPSVTNNSSSSAISVQTYDHRMKTWSKHPADFTVKRSIQGMTCCANDTNRIYVHTRTQEVASYDIIAQKWDPLPRMKRPKQYARLISYSGKIWAMGDFIPTSLWLGIEVYDDDKWETMNIFNETANDFRNDFRYAEFLDAVVFR